MNADCNIVQLWQIIHCAISFQQFTVANLHKRGIPEMTVGFWVFNNALLRITHFIVEFYIGCQPLTTAQLKQETKR